MSPSPLSISPVRLLLTGVAAVAIAFAAANADAQHRGGGKPSASDGGGKPGWSGGGGGRGWSGDGGRGWSGDGGRGWDRGGWNGGNSGRGWSGNGGWSGHGGWNGRGSYWRGHYHPYWRGYYGGRYYYPGWALGLGLGIGLTYPWWGWYPSYAYPATTVVYEGAYDAPVGVVVERDGPVSSPPPASVAPAPQYRWYCPSPAGYHPEVRDCPAGWLRVLPEGGSPPPASAPRSQAPANDVDRAGRVAPGTLGSASSARIAAPRMVAPSQLAQRAQPALAHAASY